MPTRLSQHMHPNRLELVQELHARPAEPVRERTAISRISMLVPEASFDLDLAQIARLSRMVGVAPPQADARWHAVDTGSLQVRWERHTELSTLTLAVPLVWEAPFERSALSFAPNEWLEDLPGEWLAGVHAEVRSVASVEGMSELLFGPGEFAESRLAGRRAVYAGDLRLGPDGCSRFLLGLGDVSPSTSGRVLQSILEIDTYVMAALLGFPAAQSARRDLAGLEADFGAAMNRLTHGDGNDRELLGSISGLAARAESLSAKTGYRFAASRAYHRLVQERVESLQEQPSGRGRPTLSSFLQRRLSPAMRTCDAMAAREGALIERVDRASRLLATRVQVKAEEQTGELLRSMDRRARLQLRLQETVEGLSVFAIGYYTLGLLGVAFKGIEAGGVHVNAALVTAIALPIVMLVVWIGLRAVKSRVSDKNESSSQGGLE